MTSGTDSRSPGALAGLRVIDFGQGVSAPIAPGCSPTTAPT